MQTFEVTWRVEEVVNGPGAHDGGVRNGDRTVVASGQVSKEGDSAEALRSELTVALEKSFPRHAMGPTYDIDRIYHIDIEAAA